MTSKLPFITVTIFAVLTIDSFAQENQISQRQEKTPQTDTGSEIIIKTTELKVLLAQLEITYKQLLDARQDARRPGIEKDDLDKIGDNISFLIEEKKNLEEQIRSLSKDIYTSHQDNNKAQQGAAANP